MVRANALAVALVPVALFFAPVACRQAGATGQNLETRNVILITIDGLRHQELFGGIDRVLLDDKKSSGIRDVVRIGQRYWRPSVEERRRAIMPFFWSTLAPRGIVLGNKALGSRVTVSNPQRVSYPGYAEILTGQAQKAITGNNRVRIPRETVLEFARRKLHLERTGVAAFASWEVFHFITAHEEGSIFSNAGFQRVPAELETAGMRVLTDLQVKALTPWDSVRHDAVTAGLALEYLRKHRPRLLYVALDETDDWAHDRRYDRVIDAARFADDWLRDLWTSLQSMEGYRGKTTLIMTTDHGRGGGPEDWTSHGSKVEGAEDIWVAVIGPDTPDRGEMAPSETYSQSNVAATILAFFALDYREFNPQAGAPISLAFGR